MIKYYTRACNFKYGLKAKKINKGKKALPLCGNKNISFDQVEIISKKKKIYSKIINLKKINTLNSTLKNKVRKDLKNITSKEKTFFNHVDFAKPSIMGILNLDSG